MIKGIGVDIVEVHRIRALMRNDKFMDRVYDPVELEFLGSGDIAPSLAARFAAKEAVVKAMGTGFRDMKIRDIMILKDELGKPYVVLKNNAKAMADKIGIAYFELSLSHSRNDAIAYCIGIGE